MPIYEYRCERGHAFECLQRMGADAIDSCTICGAVATRVFRAPAVHFKGSGFYTTDYGKKSRGGSENGANGGGGESGSDKKESGEKKDSKEKKETKTEPKAAASGASSD